MRLVGCSGKLPGGAWLATISASRILAYLSTNSHSRGTRLKNRREHADTLLLEHEYLRMLPADIHHELLLPGGRSLTHRTAHGLSNTPVWCKKKWGYCISSDCKGDGPMSPETSS